MTTPIFEIGPTSTGDYYLATRRSRRWAGPLPSFIGPLVLNSGVRISFSRPSHLSPTPFRHYHRLYSISSSRRCRHSLRSIINRRRISSDRVDTAPTRSKSAPLSMSSSDRDLLHASPTLPLTVMQGTITGRTGEPDCGGGGGRRRRHGGWWASASHRKRREFARYRL